jgi:hypothetical protein
MLPQSAIDTKDRRLEDHLLASPCVVLLMGPDYSKQSLLYAVSQKLITLMSPSGLPRTAVNPLEARPGYLWTSKQGPKGIAIEEDVAHMWVCISPPAVSSCSEPYFPITRIFWLLVVTNNTI